MLNISIVYIVVVVVDPVDRVDNAWVAAWPAHPSWVAGQAATNSSSDAAVTAARALWILFCMAGYN